MRKAILFLFLFFLSYYGVSANLVIFEYDSTGVVANPNGFTVIEEGTKILKSGTGGIEYIDYNPNSRTKITDYISPLNFRIEYEYFNNKRDSTFPLFFSTTGPNPLEMYFGDWASSYIVNANSTDRFVYNTPTPDGVYEKLIVTKQSDTLTFRTEYDGGFNEYTMPYTFTSNGFSFGGMDTAGFQGAELISIRIIDLDQAGGVCSMESMPNYQNINIQPTSSGAITEYIEDPIDLIYAYSTSLSGDQPLTVVASGLKNQTGFSDFSIQAGSVEFNTNRNELFFGSFFEDQTTLSISAKNGIQYIKLLGDYGLIDIIAYREDSKTVEYRINGVDLNSFDTEIGYPIGGNYLVTILFRNGFFKKTLDTLEIYSIGSNNTTTIEICYSEDTNTYTVDGEAYYEGGNPYVDLVGEAVEENVNFYNDGYTFFENGFCLRNFTAFPIGGELYFQIQKPNGELVTTYSLFPSGLQRYGNNTCTPITTNYHNLAGKYYVKGFYKNKGVVYKVNENFTTYQINSPEYIGIDQNPWADNVEACGVNENSNGFLPGVSRFFACLTQTISDFFKNQYQAVKGIGELILKMTNIFSTEVKDFSFIENSFASPPLSETLNFSEPVGFGDTIFGKIKTLLWGVIATMVIIVSIGVFIYVKSND